MQSRKISMTVSIDYLFILPFGRQFLHFSFQRKTDAQSSFMSNLIQTLKC